MEEMTARECGMSMDEATEMITAVGKDTLHAVKASLHGTRSSTEQEVYADGEDIRLTYKTSTRCFSSIVPLPAR